MKLMCCSFAALLGVSLMISSANAQETKQCGGEGPINCPMYIPNDENCLDGGIVIEPGQPQTYCSCPTLEFCADPGGALFSLGTGGGFTGAWHVIEIHDDGKIYQVSWSLFEQKTKTHIGTANREDVEALAIALYTGDFFDSNDAGTPSNMTTTFSAKITRENETWKRRYSWPATFETDVPDEVTKEVALFYEATKCANGGRAECAEGYECMPRWFACGLACDAVRWECMASE